MKIETPKPCKCISKQTCAKCKEILDEITRKNMKMVTDLENHQKRKYKGDEPKYGDKYEKM